MQYRPNIVSVGLRTGTTRTIGFVSDTVATSRLAGDMIKGALEAARERGVMLFIGETEGDSELERLLLQAMHDRQVDGIILASMFTSAVTAEGSRPLPPSCSTLFRGRHPCPRSCPTRPRAADLGRTPVDAGHREAST